MGPLLRVGTLRWLLANGRFAGVAAAVCPIPSFHPLNVQMSLSTIGAAYGTSKSGIGIAGIGQFR